MSNIVLIWRISVVIFVVETAIILAFSVSPASIQLWLEQYPLLMIMLDTITLVFVSSPIIYFWAIYPFVLARDKAEFRLTSNIATEMSTLIEAVNAPIFGVDADGKINVWNLQAEKITGFKKEAVLGRDLVADFIIDDYKISVGEVLADTYRGEETANFEFPLFTQSGSRIDILLNATARINTAGQIVGVVGVGLVITELRGSRARFKAAMDCAFDAIIGLDLHGKVVEFNAAAEAIFGYTYQEAFGKGLEEMIIPHRYREAHSRGWKGFLETGVGRIMGNRFEIEALHHDGHEFPVEIAVAKVVGFSGGVTAIGFIRDITDSREAECELNKVRDEQERERKEATAQIIQASKLSFLGEMATSVAHELNQPLNVIRMAAGNSRRKVSEGTADLEYLNDKLVRIEGQTARAAAIIDHMRMFGREATEDSILIDPRKVLADALDLMGEQLRLDGIEIVTELAGDCPSIFGHAIQMEQVILNLLSNARDAMSGRDEKKITLRVFEGDQVVHITSEDTGEGIPIDVLPHIFEPFYTTKEMGKGTGLGLSVSYGIIHDMNGTIVAKNIDDGAQFTITLPISP
ncbi:MAG: PAS domain S-box-containing protein [Candidatus Azotimanducaceae bacterium]|jgi:PAS domain S-box-containing protein